MTEHDPRDARMDERLRTAGEQWRAGLPAAGRPPVPVAEAGRRRWLVPAAAAAAAVAAITATTLALGNEHGEDPAPPVTSEPTSTPTTTPTEGTPTTPAVSVACAAGDLVPGVPSTGVAAGTVAITVPLTLATDAESCTIGGYAEVAFLDHGSDLGLRATHNPAWPDTPVTVRRGTTVGVTVGWAVHHDCSDVDNDMLRLTLPGGQMVEVDGFGATSCEPGESTSPPWVGALTTDVAAGAATTTSATPPDAACGPGDLVLGSPMTEGAAGTMVTYADLTLADGKDPCTMRGYPEVAFLDHGKDLGLTPGHNKAFDPENVRMAPGTTATVIVGWAVHHYCGDLDNDAVRLTLPGGQVVDLPGFGPTSCDPGEGLPQPWIGAVTRK